jgi:hypothetical protein
MQRRFHMLLPAAVLLAAMAVAPDARAAAEVHRLNLIFSAMPTSIDGGDFRRDLDFFNQNFLEARGLKGLDPVTSGWMFGTGLRYLVRSNFALDVGVDQLKAQTKREYLPALAQSVQIREEILSVPVHVGGAYYFQAYNSGDFQARTFLGGGLLSLGMNRVTQQTSIVAPDSAGISTGQNSLIRWTGFSPGYYIEGGFHMFFASRFSVLMSANFHSAKTREMYYSQAPVAIENGPAYNLHAGTPYTLDVSGIGIKLTIGMGL